MTKEEIIKLIINTSCLMKADIAFMLAMADIESSFKQNSNTNVGNYIGLYQLGTSYTSDCLTKFGITIKNRVSDDFGQIRCVWATHQDYKKRWNNKNHEWEDWFYYMIHQQGATGFNRLLNNKNEKIENYNNILNNSKGIWGLTKDSKVSEFLDCWKKEINSKIDYYSKEYAKEIKECEDKKNPPKIEQWKPEEDTQPLDKLKVEPQSRLDRINEAGLEQQKFYEKLKADGWYPQFEPNEPITKNKNDEPFDFWKYQIKTVFHPGGIKSKKHLPPNFVEDI